MLPRLACRIPNGWNAPLLIVVKAPGCDVGADELRHFLETKLVKWWLPDAIEFVDALVVGATGKGLKRELRERIRRLSIARLNALGGRRAQCACDRGQFMRLCARR